MRLLQARYAIIPRAMSAARKPALSRRWCYSVNLRTAIVLVLVCGGAMGWTASLIRSGHAQRVAIESFRNAGYRQQCFDGCVVLYYNPDEIDAAEGTGGTDWRIWLGKRFGQDYFRDVVYLDLAGSLGRPTSVDPLRPLEAFPRLEHLHLQACGTTDADLVRVGHCAHLRNLIIINSSITNAGLAHLAGLKGLRRLRLNRCRITDAGLDHLANIKGLERLDLVCITGRVTASGVAKLKRSLPSARITLNSVLISVTPDPPEPK